ncbi:hypothetical protein ASG66_15045 [Bacillus sp. Leaf406]|nr:hypothetical protein ASG66_15045 [Bacillus sp. Leaf406]
MVLQEYVIVLTAFPRADERHGNMIQASDQYAHQETTIQKSSTSILQTPPKTSQWTQQKLSKRLNNQQIPTNRPAKYDKKNINHLILFFIKN